MILSICIPSYNRGARALNLVNELLPLLSEFEGDIEIVVSNNGSTVGVDEYSVIKDMQEENLIYYEFEQNQMYLGNYNKVIKLSRGDFCLIVSDEDHLDFEGLRFYVELLRNNPQLGLVKAKTSLNYKGQENNVYLKAGKDAISDYFLIGSYISGVIYNRSIVSNELIDKLYKMYKKQSDNVAYFWYPHLFVEATVMLAADIFRCSIPLVIEGEDQGDQLRDDSTKILAYATYEDRMKQAKGYLAYVNNIKCNDGIKLKMITMIIDKTYMLIYTQADAYKKLGVEYSDILEIITKDMKKLINNMTLPVVRNNIGIVYEYVDAINASYLREWNEKNNSL